MNNKPTSRKRELILIQFPTFSPTRLISSQAHRVGKLGAERVHGCDVDQRLRREVKLLGKF